MLGRLDALHKNELGEAPSPCHELGPELVTVQVIAPALALGLEDVATRSGHGIRDDAGRLGVVKVVEAPLAGIDVTEPDRILC